MMMMRIKIICGDVDVPIPENDADQDEICGDVEMMMQKTMRIKMVSVVMLMSVRMMQKMMIKMVSVVMLMSVRMMQRMMQI